MSAGQPEALERAASLLREEARPDPPDAERGYLDLLGPERPASPGPVQDLMLSRPLARVYERWWRPALGRMAKGVLGPGMAGERRIARAALALGPGERVLDVACGTGAFTRDFGRVVGEAGLAVGIDVSETMLARATLETARAGPAPVAFVRCDAESLPFRDGSFHGVCCFAALNLFGDPWRALDHMTRALAPGGRIAIFTSARGRSTPLRAWEWAVARQTGMRMFERWEVVEALDERGYREVSQRLTGVTQFVSAQRPAR